MKKTEIVEIKKHVSVTNQDRSSPAIHDRNADYKAVFGTEFESLVDNLVCKSAALIPVGKEELKQELMVKAMHELQPKDYVESLLCAQFATLHMIGIQFLNAALKADMRCHQDPDLNNGIKLLRLQHETLETLSRYRRKGEQKVVVQHVQVNEGGKAIVGGNMLAGGGDD